MPPGERWHPGNGEIGIRFADAAPAASPRVRRMPAMGTCRDGVLNEEKILKRALAGPPVLTRHARLRRSVTPSTTNRYADCFMQLSEQQSPAELWTTTVEAGKRLPQCQPRMRALPSDGGTPIHTVTDFDLVPWKTSPTVHQPRHLGRARATAGASARRTHRQALEGQARRLPRDVSGHPHRLGHTEHTDCSVEALAERGDDRLARSTR